MFCFFCFGRYHFFLLVDKFFLDPMTITYFFSQKKVLLKFMMDKCMNKIFDYEREIRRENQFVGLFTAYLLGSFRQIS